VAEDCDLREKGARSAGKQKYAEKLAISEKWSNVRNTANVG